MEVYLIEVSKNTKLYARLLFLLMKSNFRLFKGLNLMDCIMDLENHFLK